MSEVGSHVQMIPRRKKLSPAITVRTVHRCVESGVAAHRYAVDAAHNQTADTSCVYYRGHGTRKPTHTHTTNNKSLQPAGGSGGRRSRRSPPSAARVETGAERTNTNTLVTSCADFQTNEDGRQGPIIAACRRRTREVHHWPGFADTGHRRLY